MGLIDIFLAICGLDQAERFHYHGYAQDWMAHPFSRPPASAKLSVHSGSFFADF